MAHRPSPPHKPVSLPLPHCAISPPTLTSGLTVALPADYIGFCMHYQDRYLRYTRVRVADPGLSRELVETTLGSVAVNWADLLASPCPAAEAWAILGSVIAQAARGQAATSLSSVAYRILPALQADVVILRHRLCLSNEQTADLLGVEESVVTSQLRMAHRTMSGHPEHSPIPAATGLL
ncbi:hypothetical protein [Streptomyces sp. AM8-1-1]|uniref:hypothetical protein n=1 Tax=Streptomyces sp. AM8-1-1 TaxID=3075825 RepID=UPI0028C3A843|nr:hypothetical protein [Streptomyces sp. AM8-1-1]WNO70153.1 hypothetical protein RPQ07_00195 [Streptomyces sp. AM8-1-1]WNO76963.1 hypothetical protein RPQ07_37530 [Streptomyces sp. AM8-1-1]